MLLASNVELPLIFILKGEAWPPINLTEDNKSFWSFSFLILNDWVTDPTVVNTVSNFILSADIYKEALPLVIKESFLQEEKQIKQEMMMKEYMVNFIFQM